MAVAAAVAVAIFDGNDFTTRLSGLNTNTGEDVSAGAPETAAPPPTPGAPRGEGAARRPPDASAAPLPENAVGGRDVNILFLRRRTYSLPVLPFPSTSNLQRP